MKKASKIHTAWFFVVPNAIVALGVFMNTYGPWAILESCGKAVVFVVWFALALSAVLALVASVIAMVVSPLYNVLSQIYFDSREEWSFKSGEPLVYTVALLVCGLFVANGSSLITWGTPDFAVLLCFETLWPFMKQVYIAALVVSSMLCVLEVFPLARLRYRMRIMLDRRALN